MYECEKDSEIASIKGEKDKSMLSMLVSGATLVIVETHDMFRVGSINLAHDLDMYCPYRLSVR